LRRLALIATLSVVVGACTTAPVRRGPAPPDPAATFVAAATAMVGRPYRYGGADPSGFDCSGLVNFAAAAAGLQLPRTARELLGAGSAVGRDAQAPGDLVFMHLTSKELHVGIALDGTRFVHAPSARGRVRIDSLEAAPYAGAYFATRRLAFPPASAGSTMRPLEISPH
jgi:cell wall-associated NlpC family hydrolase